LNGNDRDGNIEENKELIYGLNGKSDRRNGRK
jgi:hypothetical protein